MTAIIRQLEKMYPDYVWEGGETSYWTGVRGDGHKLIVCGGDWSNSRNGMEYCCFDDAAGTKEVIPIKRRHKELKGTPVYFNR